MQITMTRGVLAAMLAQATRSAQMEACGLLLGTKDAWGNEHVAAFLPTANIAADPARHFEIDPAALIAAHRRAREGGPAVLGYFHSHPSGAGAPSMTDRAMASGDGRIWAIAAAGGVEFWRDTPSGFEALSSRTVED